jgi:pimeloyl-ACP methyl ester carboxylesterase
MRPYRVDIPQEALDDLRSRLGSTRWPAETPDVGWSRGVPLPYMRELAEYWRTEYDWRAAEARINKFPQFMTTIDGANIHLLHVRSPEPDAVPMVLTTGWPSSIVEYLDLIGPLTDPRAHGGDPRNAYHVVIPTLPGLGFSTPLTEHGWSVPRVAGVWAKLMASLGYDRYIAHGADWGSFVSLVLGLIDSEHVLGTHVNFLVTQPADASDLVGLDDRDLARLDPYMLPAPAYMVAHVTRPQTLSYSLLDSPVGHLAWYVEKFFEWSAAEKSPEDVFDRDALLDIVTLYWLTGTAGTAAHFYSDNAPITRTSATPHPELAVAHDRFAAFRTQAGPLPPVPGPVGVTLYPHDIMQPIRSYAERDFPNIVHWSTMEKGGHFPGLDAPEEFLADLLAFGRTVRGAA